MKEFILTDGQLPSCIEWVNMKGLAWDPFPVPHHDLAEDESIINETTKDRERRLMLKRATPDQIARRDSIGESTFRLVQQVLAIDRNWQMPSISITDVVSEIRRFEAIRRAAEARLAELVRKE